MGIETSSVFEIIKLIGFLGITIGAIVVISVLISVFLLGGYASIVLIKRIIGTKKKKAFKKKKKYVTFTKRYFKYIINHSIIWVYLSFILAFMDKISIAEAISVQAIVTIIGAFISYCAKSVYEKKIGKEKEDYENINEEIYQ